MAIREKLMRNEILHLAENLRLVSQELITLQDFVKKEFGTKYLRFCEGRSRREEEKISVSQRAELFNGNISSLSFVPQRERSFRNDRTKYNASGSLSSILQPVVSLEETGSSGSTQFRDMPDTEDIPGQVEEENNSDSSDHPIFRAWKTEVDDDDLDLYIPGSDVEIENENSSSADQEEPDPKRKKSERKEQPTSRPINLLKFIKSSNRRGKEMVVCDGFIFHRNRMTEKTDYYLCNNCKNQKHKDGCNARLVIRKDQGTFLHKGTHSHMPNPDRIRAHEVIAAGKQLAIDNPELPMKQVMSHIESLIVEDPTTNPGEALRSATYVKRRINRARQKEGVTLKKRTRPVRKDVEIVPYSS